MNDHDSIIYLQEEVSHLKAQVEKLEVREGELENEVYYWSTLWRKETGRSFHLDKQVKALTADLRRANDYIASSWEEFVVCRRELGGAIERVAQLENTAHDLVDVKVENRRLSERVSELEELTTHFRQKLERAIAELEKHKPFVGVPEKTYYRAQWDALDWVMTELFGEETRQDPSMSNEEWNRQHLKTTAQEQPLLPECPVCKKKWAHEHGCTYVSTQVHGMNHCYSDEYGGCKDPATCICFCHTSNIPQPKKSGG